MKKHYIPIRFKLTLMSILVLSAGCLLITLNANEAGSILAAKTTEMALVNVKSLYGEYPLTEIIPATLINTDAQIITPVQLAEAKSAFKLNTTFMMFLIVLLGSSFTYFYSKRILEPLENLNKVLKTSDIDNLCDFKVNSKQNNEIRELENSYIDLANKIQHSYNNQKRFSMDVAHELRTPLAVLQTKLDVFKLKYTNDDEVVMNFLDIINRNIFRLSYIVNNLLTLTSNSNVKMDDNISLREIIEEIIFNLEDKANSSQIKITLTADDSCVLGNDGLLQQTFYNLIDNAIKYNVSGGKIDISIKDKIVSVADSGEGIDDDKKAFIFDPFYRVDESRNQEIEGSGLGLSIVKNIIDKHHGKIEVSNNDPCGTIFRVIL